MHSDSHSVCMSARTVSDGQQIYVHTQKGEDYVTAETIIKHRWDELDALYDGILAKARQMVHGKVVVHDENALRKAIMVKLWIIGKLKLEKMKKHAFESILTEQQLKVWAADDAVQNLVIHLSLSGIC